MRLWHKDLIPYLPRQQLLSQWRECCCIARNIAVNGTPNHILVNPVMNYPICHFIRYSWMVYCEMLDREYKVDWDKFGRYFSESLKFKAGHLLCSSDVFVKWHNTRYLTQCYYNLQEKYDRGGIPDEEWLKFETAVNELLHPWMKEE